MPAVQFEVAGFAAYLHKPAQKFILDLSGYSMSEVIVEYQKFKRRTRPHYNVEGLLYNIKNIEETFNITLQPIQVTDDFYSHFYQYLIVKGNKPSTIATYFCQLKTSLEWGMRHNLTVSSTYDQFDVDKYEKTKVALTPDEVSLIYHFDIANAVRKLHEEEHKDYTEVAIKRVMDAIRTQEDLLPGRIADVKEKYARKVNKIRNSKLSSKKKKERIKSEHIKELAKINALRKHIEDIKRLDNINVAVAKQNEAIKKVAAKLLEKKIETYIRVRDQFVLQCNLGQRYSDISRITPSCFDETGTIFTIIQQKTGNKAVVDIPTYAFDKRVAREILTRYNFHSPYPHDITNFNHKLHEILKLIGGPFNDLVKTENKIRGEIVSEEIPKWKAIASHTARRSFATYNIGRGFPEYKVRRATGHMDSRSFNQYIIFDEE